MLTMNEIVEKLNVAPVQFNRMMQQERYCEAKWLFYNCMVTALFIELDEAAMERLFGEQGVFKPELVKKAYEKAGGGIDRTAKDYAETERCRRDVRFSFRQERVLERPASISDGVKRSRVCGVE